MKNRNIKRVLGIVLSIVLVMSNVAYADTATTEPAKYSDIVGNRYEQQIREWIANGFIKGYPDGTFKPENQITRAEFMTLVNRAFGFTDTMDVNYSDTSKSAWYYKDAAKATKAGFIKGDNGRLLPLNNISRQEIAMILARLTKSESAVADEAIINNLNDAKSIPAWSKAVISVGLKKGLFEGFADKTFKPEENITRLEAVVALDRAFKSMYKAVYTMKGEYGPATGTQIIDGDVAVIAPDVTIKNVTINGNLILRETIGEGNVTLDNVVVKGETIVKGGGANSIVINNSTLGKVIVIKEGNTVRIVATGSSNIDNVNVGANAKLEEYQLTGAGFNDVLVLDDIPDGANVVFVGNFGDVGIDSPNINVTMQSGTIGSLNLAETAVNTNINLGQNATVNTMTLDAAANITGTGTIGTANINASGTTIEQKPTTVNVPTGVDATVGGGPAASTPPPAAGGGGGGGSPRPSNRDATLSNLKVNGTTIIGFGPDILNYTVYLPTGTVEVPTVTATVNDTGKATLVITSAASLPGATTIVVTAQDKKTINTYTINFKLISDKTALEAAIAIAEAKVEASYTAQSWAVMQEALTEARTVDADDAATAEQVSTAATELTNAINGLIMKTTPEILKGYLSSNSTETYTLTDNVTLDGLTLGADKTIAMSGYKVTISGVIATSGNTITTIGSGIVEFSAGFSITGANNGEVIIVNTANEASFELGAGAVIPFEYEWRANGSNSEFVKKVPAEVTIALPEGGFTVGVKAEFTVSTKAHSYSDLMVIGNSSFANPEAIETLEYYEVKNGTWYPLAGDFGPSTGFPLADATSRFRVSFKTPGSYEFTVNIREAANHDNIVASETASFNVIAGNIDAAAAVINASTLEVAMNQLEGATFKWNGGIIPGSNYDNGKYTLTVPCITSTTNTLVISASGYNSKTVEVVVSENASNLYIIDNAAELDAAISNQADNQVWIIKSGDYAVESKYRFDIDSTGDNGYNKYYFPIKANNLKIIGEGNPIIYGSTLTLNGVRATQNFITVMADGVTIDGVTIMSKLAPNKAIEVAGDRGGKNFTLKNSTVTKNIKVIYNNEDVTDYFGRNEKLTNEDIDFPGSVYFYENVGSSIVENVVIEKGRISAGTINGGASVALKNVSVDFVDSVEEDDAGYYPISTNARKVNMTADNVTVKVGNAVAYKLQDIIDNVPLGTTVVLAPGTYFNATGSAPTAPEGVTLVIKGVIFVKADKFISNVNELTAAINSQEDGQTWVIKSGIYDIPMDATTNRDSNGKIVVSGGQAGWYMPITANNLTILGIDNPTITSSAFAKNGSWASQNLITVWGDNVTLKGLTIQPKVEENKSIEVVGNKQFTIENCTFTPNTVAAGADAAYGGSLYFNGAGAARDKAILVKNNTFNYALIAFDGVEGSDADFDIIIECNTFDNISGYAIGNTYWGSEDRKTVQYADVIVNGNSYKNVADGTKIIAARLNQTFILDKSNKVNGTLIDKYNFSQYINFNNLTYWPECKNNKVIVDGVLYESPTKDIDAYVTTTQQLFNAIANAKAGDTILVAEGTYRLDRQIRIEKALNIIGAGDSTVFTKGDAPWTNATGSKGYAPIITIMSGDGAVKLENIKVSGAANIAMTGPSGGTDYGSGINVVASSKVTLKNVTSTDNAAAGLIVNSSTVTANNLNTSGNGWYSVNVDKKDAGAASFTLTGTGVLEEKIQIKSDNTADVTVDAVGYKKYMLEGTTVTIWSNKLLENMASITNDDGTKYYPTIQAAAEAAVEGDTIKVMPGIYNKGAYIKLDKDDVTIMGVDAEGNEITSADNILATVGPFTGGEADMVFHVIANNVTIKGIRIADKNNKSMTINGDNFTLTNCEFKNEWNSSGAIYFYDASAGVKSDENKSIQKSFTITNNKINGWGVAITDGTGYGWPADQRVISNNIFDGPEGDIYYSIGFRSVNETGWCNSPVGGATIMNNTFKNLGSMGYIYFDGEVPATGLDFEDIMRNNTFENGAVMSFDENMIPRTVLASDPDNKPTRPNLVMLKDSIAYELAKSQDGDTILITEGTYKLTKQLELTMPITIKGMGAVEMMPAANFDLGTYSADKHLISINGVIGQVRLENLIVRNSKRAGINVFESDDVYLNHITSKNNAAVGLIVNNSIVVADDLNTSENGWGYGINVDNGSNPSPGAPETSFTLNSGIISEDKQIVSDKGGVTIIAPDYQIFINDASIVFGATITDWYTLENEGNTYDLLDTSINFDFDKIDISEIDSIKFSLYQGNTLLGTAISSGDNLVTLLKDCAQYWGQTAETYADVTGIRTMSSAFMNRTEKSDNGYWVRSVCTATKDSVPNGLIVTVVAGNVTYTATLNK